jgi:hypothetical protein
MTYRNYRLVPFLCFALIAVVAAAAIEIASSPSPSGKRRHFTAFVQNAVQKVFAITHSLAPAYVSAKDWTVQQIPSASCPDFSITATEDRSERQTLSDGIPDSSVELTMEAADKTISLERQEPSYKDFTFGGRTWLRRANAVTSGKSTTVSTSAATAQAPQRASSVAAAMETFGAVLANQDESQNVGDPSIAVDLSDTANENNPEQIIYGAYPFADFSNPFDQVLPDVSKIFLEPVSLSIGETAGELYLGGFYGDMLALVAECPRETLTWRLTRNGGGEPITVQNRVLVLDGLETGVYSVDICTGAGCFTTFYLAKPINTAVPDLFVPSGNIHAEFVNDSSGDLTFKLRVWGKAYDAIQSALAKGGSGISDAFVIIDGQRVDVTLNDQGEFETIVTVARDPYGVHDCQLWARDPCHTTTPTKVDADYVSEYAKRFKDVQNADPSNWDNWQIGSYACSMMCVLTRAGSFIIQQPYADYREGAVAKAEASLDGKSYLVFDGGHSVNAAKYLWTIKNIVSGVEYGKEGITVETEDLPAGLYEVTLRVPTITDDHQYAYSQDSFCIVVPPRMDLSVRRITGAVHSRWFSIATGESYSWNLQLEGHVFDEIGAAVYGNTAKDFDAWVEVNGAITPVVLDSKGGFNTTLHIGQNLDSEYNISLHVSAHGADAVEVDSQRQEYLHVFRISASTR